MAENTAMGQSAGKKPEKLVLFYRNNGDTAYLANWYQSPFTYVDGEYSCAEQYMMQQKMLLFGAGDVADRIMRESDPMNIKKLGRTRIQGFADDLWIDVRMQVLRRGLRAKFQCAPELLDRLLTTGEAILADGSPKDTVWGIGMSVAEGKQRGVLEWGGKNLAGKTMMTVRRDLKLWKGMAGDEVYHYVPAGDHPSVLDSVLGDMSFAELHRLTGAAAITDSYVDVCAHYLTHLGTRKAFYLATKDISLREFNDTMRERMRLMQAPDPRQGHWEPVNQETRKDRKKVRKDHQWDAWKDGPLGEIEELPLQGYREMLQDLQDMYRFGCI